MEKYDLCVIGAGPAGYAATMRAIDLGKRVLLVEKNKLGGAGLHNGALSSKTFWEIAHEIADARDKAHRLAGTTIDISFPEVAEEVSEAVNMRAEMLERHIKMVTSDGSPGSVDLVFGRAEMESEHIIAIHTAEGSRRAEAANIILATGSRPRKLPSFPIDEKIVLTSDGIESLEEYPESIVILGAGVIGCEFATIFSLLGHTKVFLIDKGDRILPFEDADVVRIVEQNLEESGVHIHRNSRMTRMEIVDGRVEYELKFKDGRIEVFHVEKALISIGRVPNTEGIGLEKAGIELTDRGHIKETEKDTSTSVPHIYAVGDITADIALVNVGELEGRYAVEKIFGDPKHKLCYENISTIMFLHPEVAGVGMNEQQAREKGIPYRVASINYHCIARAIAMRKTDGFFKILVSDDDEMKILGMRAIGPHASSAIQAVALLISMDKGIHALSECIHPHPSIIEGIQECVRMLLGKSILKPSAFKEELRCCRWTGGEEYEEIPVSVI